MFDNVYSKSLGNRRGATLITALMILAIVTMLGLISNMKAVTEQQIASNQRTNTVNFYMAESGLGHARRILMDLFAADTSNQTLIAADSSAQPVWTFILNGSLPSYPLPATFYYCEGCAAGDSNIDGPWVAGGVQVLQRTIVLENTSYTYTVTAWNNNDEVLACYVPLTDSGATDCDGQITIRSVSQAFDVASGVQVAESILELGMSAGLTSVENITDGNSGEFGLGGANASTADKSEMADFTNTVI